MYQYIYKENLSLTHAYIFLFLTTLTCVQSFQFRQNRPRRIRCYDSSKTIREVQSCPTNKESLEDRARRMDCGKIQQNCSGSSLVYHCLLDGYGRGLIEVCALTTEIIGRRCPEFNSGAMFVQEHLEKRCKKCPFAYLSNEGYLYDECLEVEEGLTTTKSTTDKDTTSLLEFSLITLGNNTLKHDERIEDREENLIFWIIPFILGIFLPMISFAMIVFLFLNCHTRKSNNREMDRNETQFFLKEKIP